MLSKQERALLYELLQKSQKGRCRCNYHIASNPGTFISISDIRKLLACSNNESVDGADAVLCVSDPDNPGETQLTRQKL